MERKMAGTWTEFTISIPLSKVLAISATFTSKSAWTYTGSNLTTKAYNQFCAFSYKLLPLKVAKYV